MKKTLSIILTLCMVLGLCSFSVAAAPEGTAITDAAGFAAMDPTGTYYLANDITITEPYTQSFVGTFDGNGKTVTISQPMFVDFGGKIKNLTIEGSVTSQPTESEIVVLNADGARGALTCRVNCGTEVVFENIVNNASVSATGNLAGDDCSGGIVGKVEFEGASVKFVNCTNNGAITGINQVGGICGYVKAGAAVSFEGCTNNGNVKETNENSYCAGILCRSDISTKFVDCVNNAVISSGKDQAAGIFAYAGKASHEFYNCVNNGDITPTAGKAGGIIGGINSNDADGKNNYYIKIEKCANFGKIVAKNDPDTDGYAGGIIAQPQKNLNTVITECVNYGEVIGQHDAGGIVGHSTQAILNISLCENFADITSETDYAGGIVGYGWGTKTSSVTAAEGDYCNIVEYCVNHGNVIAAARAGGIIATTGTTDSRGITLVQYCVNIGNVTSIGSKTNASGNCAGGIVGYAYGYDKDTRTYVVVDHNITIGNVEQKNATIGNASYFLGYVNSAHSVVTNNIAIGTITNAAPDTGVLAWNNGQQFADDKITGNIIPASNTLPLTFEFDAANSVAITNKAPAVGATNEADLTGGKLVYEFNQAYKAATGSTEDFLYITLDGTFAPTLIAAEDGSNSVILNADGTYGNPVKEEETTAPAPETTEPAPETTEPAPETTAPSEGPSTGDSFVVFAAIAVVAVLGVAIVAKRREN